MKIGIILNAFVINYDVFVHFERKCMNLLDLNINLMKLRIRRI